MDDYTPETIRIELTQGQFAIVDLQDGFLTDFTWQADLDRKYANGGAYKARRTIIVQGRKTGILMHRQLMEYILGRPLQKNEEVDHIDLNPLNNTRKNLRLATHAENSRNRRKRRDNTSGYTGVTFIKARSAWIAIIYVNRKRVWSSGFKTTALEAHEARCKAIDQYHGSFARHE